MRACRILSGVIAGLALFTCGHSELRAGPRRDPAPSIPLAFAPNRGQWDTGVGFLARAGDAAVALGPARAEMATRGGRTVSMDLVGGDPRATAAPLEPLPGTASFFVGRDRSRWRERLPTYAAVRYDRVYPGIDVTWHGRAERIEYDFTVAPGADPSRIRLRFAGVDGARVDRSGDLLLSLAGEEVRHLRPVAFQRRGSVREAVDAAWSLGETPDAAFRVGPYDRSRALVIDPVVVGSSVIGGSGLDSANAVAVDPFGNVYVAGDTFSADFPAPPPFRGVTDVFVAKLDPTGRTLLSSTFLGGAESDTAGGISIDGSGNVWVAGETLSSDFPATPGAFQAAFAGASDAFVAKLDPSAATLVIATYLGGEGFDRANAVAANGLRVAVAGRTGSTDFPTTPDAFQTFFRGSDFDAFLTRFDAGGGVTNSSFLGGAENDAAFGVAFGPAGSVYVVGGTRSPDFPATANAYQGSNFATDAFLSKFSAGNALQYSSFLGGSAVERGNAVSVDATGRAAIAGWTSSSDFPTVAAVQMAFRGGGNDAFLAVLDPSASGDASLRFGSYLGGSGDDRAHGVAFELGGSVQVAGQTSSNDFPVVDPVSGGGGGVSDAFAVEVDLAAAPPRIRYSTVLGGGGDDRAHAVAVGLSGDALVVGRTDSTGFPPGASRIGPGGGTDAFVARIAEGGVEGVPPAVPSLSPAAAALLAGALALAGILFARRP